MARILVHLTRGPEDPTVATLGLLVARSAVAEGHEVSVFLAGDSVVLLRPAVLAALNGLGTGNAQEHVEALVSGGARFYVSGMSAAARGLEESVLADTGATFAMPTVLVQLALDHDRVFTY